MEPAEHLEIREESPQGGPDAVLALRGELDPLSAPDLARCVSAVATRTGVERLVLDLAELTFIDSSGLRALLEAGAAMSEQGRSMALRRPSEAAQRLLRITDLHDVFPVLDAED